MRLTKWKNLRPNSPYYFFVPKDESLRGEYERFPQITNIFLGNVTGIVTAKDAFVIDLDRDQLMKRILDFAKSDESRVGLLDKFNLKENYAWRVKDAQKELRNALGSAPPERFLRDILYRPFDKRVVFYHPSIVWRPRTEIMQHMLLGNNVGLVTCRQQSESGTWRHAGVCRHLMESTFISNNTREINYLFPLYLYPNGDELIQASPWPAGKDGRRPNLSPEFVEGFSSKVRLKFISDGVGDRKKTFGPEDIFHYIYATFHSPTYRTRYAEFLKIDFPRVPLTSDKKLFARLCEFGAELVGLHLLENVPTPLATYPVASDNRVEKPHYKPLTDDAPARVYVNSTQYFEDVPHDVWEFHVGGYQVCEKWLKDRKGRTLTYDDIETYRKITEAIRQTIRLMSAIDVLIPAWPLP